jgi:hypothetical protein
MSELKFRYLLTFIYSRISIFINILLIIIIIIIIIIHFMD